MLLLLKHVFFIMSLLAVLGEAGKMSPVHWLRRSAPDKYREKRQAATNSGAPATVSFTTNYEFPTGGLADTCICTLVQAYTAFVTITSTYTGSDSNDGVTTTTLAQQSGSIPRTVEIVTPIFFVTTTSFYIANDPSATASTTTIQPTGTTPGTIEVFYPQVYSTTYVASAGLVGSSTTTLTDPTGTVPGTIEVIVSSQTDYITSTNIYTGTEIVTSGYTTTVSAAGVSAGQVQVINPNYGVTTVTEGTTGATRVLQTATGTLSGTVQVNIPTPDLSCNNHGFEYAVFDNPYTRGLQHDDPTYSSFQATAFQTAAPLETGLTNYLGLPFVERGTTASIYGNPPESLNLKAINHRGYLFAKLTGQFNFDFPLSDDITLLWVGNNVYGPLYSRANANLEQLYNGGLPIDQQTRYTYNITLQQGQYEPVRVLYGNAQYDADFEFNIYAPDGELITNSSTAFVFSPYVVRYSCDGVTAPPYVPFGAEG